MKERKKMMKVLIKIHSEREPAQTPDQLAQALFNRLQNAYLDQSGDREAYLLQPDVCGKHAAETLSFIDGMENPETLKKEAENWNRRLEASFTMALHNMECTLKRRPGMGARWLSAPDPLLYDLKKAAMALDDDFYCFAECAVLTDVHDTLQCRLEDEEKNDIAAHPENYAILQVWPK